MTGQILLVVADRRGGGEKMEVFGIRKNNFCVAVFLINVMNRERLVKYTSCIIYRSQKVSHLVFVKLRCYLNENQCKLPK